MSKAAKGSDFERTLCKKISKWWTWGLEGSNVRDDVFWRSSQSGGRATQRSKSGKTTFGSYGDIAAVDPIGAPLIKMFTIELKRGSSYGSLADLIDTSPTDAIRPFEACLLQAIRSHEQAGSKGWLLVHRRDHRVAMVYSDLSTMRLFDEYLPHPLIRVDFAINCEGKKKRELKVCGYHFDTFLEHVTPQAIMACLQETNL